MFIQYYLMIFFINKHTIEIIFHSKLNCFQTKLVKSVIKLEILKFLASLDF